MAGKPYPQPMNATARFGMPRIVYCSWFGDLGGGERRMLDHIQRSRISPERLIALLGAAGDLKQKLDDLGVQTEVLRWKSERNWIAKQWQWYKTKARCGWFLIRSRPAVLLCNTWHDLETTGRVAAQLDIPIIWRARADTFVRTDSWPPAKLQELVSFLNRYVARILPTTQYEARNMMQSGVIDSKIRVIHNGVDLDRYRDESNGKRLREELRIAEETPVIAFVARIVPQKRYEVFLEALTKLKQSGYSFRALLVGDTTLLESQPDHYRAKIHRLVHEYDLDHYVMLLGAREDVNSIMKASDVFVLSSLIEPFGTTVIEAMAASRPVIASDLPGPRESAVENDTALFFPPGDVDALVHNLKRLLDDRVLRREMGVRGRQRAEALFAMDKYVHALDEEILSFASRI